MFYFGRLEKESGFFFNMKYFDEKVQAGEWDEVEKYLSGFTKVDDNRYSMKIFFEIRKQKYLEALDRYSFSLIIFIYIYSHLVIFSRKYVSFSHSYKKFNCFQQLVL